MELTEEKEISLDSVADCYEKFRINDIVRSVAITRWSFMEAWNEMTKYMYYEAHLPESEQMFQGCNLYFGPSEVSSADVRVVPLIDVDCMMLPAYAVAWIVLRNDSLWPSRSVTLQHKKGHETKRHCVNPAHFVIVENSQVTLSSNCDITQVCGRDRDRDFGRLPYTIRLRGFPTPLQESITRQKEVNH